jgi:CBS domain-containing protein/nucleotide-binding universal stress UspA family protein
MMKILIAIDGSGCSWAALDEAIKTLPLDGSAVYVIAVAPLPPIDADFPAGAPPLSRLGPAYPGAAVREARVNLDRALASLAALNVRAVPILRSGAAATEIVNAAREFAIDIVVVGSHGRSTVGRFMLGSVSDAVVHGFRGLTLVVGPDRASGKPIISTVADVMTSVALEALPTDTLDVVASKMSLADTGFIPIVLEGRLVGVVTDRDITLRAVAKGLDPRTVEASTVCSHPVIVAEKDMAIARAIELMEHHKIRRLPVVENDRLVGVLALGDLAECVPAGAEEVLVEISRSAKTLAHLPRERARQARTAP